MSGLARTVLEDEAALMEALRHGRNIQLMREYVVSTDMHGVKVAGKTPPAWKDFFETTHTQKVKTNHTRSSNFTESFLGNRYRCILANSEKGWVISMRFLPQKIPSLRDDLQMDWNMLRPLTEGAGLTLFAGRMNSGKSTTMAACIGMLDATASEIAMIEDPIEVIYPDPMIIQREIGTHVESFPEAIRDCVRQSRTTIVVSEIRDAETANAALLAASTGHSVLATIHADNAFDIYTRMLTLVDVRHERVLARNLRGLWWQHVVRFGDKERKPLPIYESLICTNPVRQIFEGGPTKLPQLAGEAVKQNRKSMGQHAASLVAQGKASREELAEFIERRNRISDQ